MLDQLDEMERSALAGLAEARDEAALEAWRVRDLGRSSDLMKVFAELAGLSKAERPAVGQAANRLRTSLEAAMAERLREVRQRSLERSLA